jgi:tellurite resistance protein TerC
VYLSLGLAVILAFIGVKLILEAVHENQLPFAGEREPIEAVPHIPIWLSLTIILGVLVIATVASLMKTRGVVAAPDEPVIDEEIAKEIPTGGPEAAAAAEAKVAEEAGEERTRR